MALASVALAINPRSNRLVAASIPAGPTNDFSERIGRLRPPAWKHVAFAAALQCRGARGRGSSATGKNIRFVSSRQTVGFADANKKTGAIFSTFQDRRFAR
jgi:hypothetical protein